MDQSTGQSQTQTPAHRDMMFCHECHDEWYRDERGLTCPECGSDFTEIIEDDNDPRDDGLFGHVDDHDHDDDHDSLPSLEEAAPHLHPLHQHNPWQTSDDPEEGDISNLQWRQLGPGRFAVNATMYRTVSPASMGRGAGGNQFTGPASIGGFASLLNQIITGQAAGQQQTQDNQPAEEQDTRPGVTSGSGTTPGGRRFHYSSSARLYPRDADHPGPHVEPVDEINNVLVGLMAAFGEPPGHHHHHHFHDDDDRDDDTARGHPLSPLMGLLAHMMPGSGQAGDFVYSQEALDRIISQLMEQNGSSNAPGPASQEEINNLPRKPVTVDMLGPEGRAECSICMDEVNTGEEVTELPCHHWFHHQCVAAWLSEHDTCPHCRKGISKSPSNEHQQDSSSGASGANPSRQMPGAFGDAGEATSVDPFVVFGSPEQNTQGGADHQPRPGSADEAGSGGLGERLRRGLFGPPR